MTSDGDKSGSLLAANQPSDIELPDIELPDAQARRRALDVTASFIVQAPAGSGKTELLIRRYLALLATVERPESVLAITFTRKAAAEMRKRVLEALRAAASPPASPQAAATIALAQAALRADATYGWNLLENPGRLRIMTIDALNVMLAQRLPLLSGIGAGLDVDERPASLYRQAAEHVHAYVADNDAVKSEAVIALLRHLDNRSSQLLDLVEQMLPRREDWLGIVQQLRSGSTLEEVRNRLERARERVVVAQLESLRSSFPTGSLHAAASLAQQRDRALAAEKAETPEQPFLHDAAAPTTRPRERLRWQALANLLLTADGKWKNARGFPAGIQRAASQLVQELEAEPGLREGLNTVRSLPPENYTDDEWRVLAAIIELLPLAAAELQVVFAETGRADYASFAAAARQALGTDDNPTDLAIALDAELRHVLVDEFQDTSLAQVRLLERLTADWTPGDGRTLFVVGDPMQSIYRFRNAEVGQFIGARARGIGHVPLEPLLLTVNFRSSTSLVAWNNATFAQVLPGSDDATSGAVRFASSTPAPGATGSGGVRVHAFFARDRVAEAERVVDLVAQALRDDRESSIAILVTGRSHLSEIVPELQRRRIPFQATDIDPLGRRPVVLDLLSLTRALVHLADRTAWLAVLRAPWCGLTLGELYAVAGPARGSILTALRSGAWRDALGPAARERVAATLRILETALEETRTLPLRDAVERAWHALAGPATVDTPRGLEEANAYLEQLSSLEARGIRLPDLDELEAALDDLYAPPAAGPAPRVQLLTIHKAKGLEFDTVIVPGLERPLRRDARSLVRWTRLAEPDGASAGMLLLAPLHARAGTQDPLYHWLGVLEAAREQQERRRLLYVAATRAKTSLHLLGSVTVKLQNGRAKLQPPARTTPLGLLWPAVEPVFASAFEAGPEWQPAAPDELRGKVSMLHRLPDEWRPPGLPAAPRIAVATVEHVADALEPEFDWASATARSVGTVVHRALQRTSSEGMALDAATIARQRSLYAIELAELGVPADRQARALERVVAALERTSRDERGRWLLAAAHRERHAELELTGRLGSEIVRVVVDRTFVADDGTRWIVDFKTSEHEGGELERFLDSEQRRYAPQLERYATLMRRFGPQPIRVGLYFPLLSAWREWPIG
jgi:ATP-dependent exoDNAse (exonuclease V) beta subunit